eukprot:Sspe_Gene.72205::Locus_43027_Transcript_1_1_Confidence_1.000_Length_1370::g.72205::m.72205
MHDDDWVPTKGYPEPLEQQMLEVQQGGAVLTGMACAQKLAIKHTGQDEGSCRCCVTCCCSEKQAFDVYDVATGEKVLRVNEESSLAARCCCAPYHKLQLKMYDASTNESLYVAHRPYRCCPQLPAWFSCSRQEMHVRSVSKGLVGTARQPLGGGVFTPTLDVQLSTGDTAFAVVEGPVCCFGGLTEMCTDQPFLISRRHGKSGDVGRIEKTRPEDLRKAVEEVLGTGDASYMLTFTDTTLTGDEKVVLLSTLLLMGYVFYQNDGGFCDSGAVVCCHFYTCGVLQPFEVKLPRCRQC